MVGDGKERPRLEARARALGLGPRVRFLGQLPAGEAVRANSTAPTSSSSHPGRRACPGR